MELLYECFHDKFESFKKEHSQHYPSSILRGEYLSDNEFPVGEKERFQLFRCLVYRMKQGNYNFTGGEGDEEMPFSVI
jgi:hypothetical protein